MNIREAKPGDETAIHGLIQALADYERAPDEVINTPEQLKIDLFEDRICEALVVENAEMVVGFALFYTSYSTWKGRCLYLEDFYVLPEFRRGGIGGKLFREVVDIAKSRGVKRMDWQVLEWNEPAIGFYKKHEAILDPEWINGRLFF
jgi:ribosomal protein S18 acetylase RimI-like enzyme